MVVWGGVVAAGLGVGYYINKKNAAKAAAAPVQTGESGVGLGGTGGFSNVNPPAAAPVAEDTNPAWGRRVVDWLVAQNFDPGTADNAVRKYLYGVNLSLTEQAMMNMAILHFGAPPEPLPPVTVPTVPPPKVLNVHGDSPEIGTNVITWDAAPGSTSYVIDVDPGGGHVEQTGTRYAHSGQNPPGIPHLYTIYAVNAGGKSPPEYITWHSRVPDAPAQQTPAQPAPTPGPAPGPAPAPQPRRELVRPGDTLTGIALRVYGNAGRWRDIYNRNSGVIEGAARAHAKRSSTGGPRNEVGWWIYSGTVLEIP